MQRQKLNNGQNKTKKMKVEITFVIKKVKFYTDKCVWKLTQMLDCLKPKHKPGIDVFEHIYALNRCDGFGESVV